MLIKCVAYLTYNLHHTYQNIYPPVCYHISVLAENMFLDRFEYFKCCVSLKCYELIIEMGIPQASNIYHNEN